MAQCKQHLAQCQRWKVKKESMNLKTVQLAGRLEYGHLKWVFKIYKWDGLKSDVCEINFGISHKTIIIKKKA